MLHITRNLIIFLGLTALYLTHAHSAFATTYYVSPNGDDANDGLSQQTPWGTLDHSWQDVYPGDTLLLMDGVYYESFVPNKRNGEPGNPITVEALNDGQAIIDGQHQRITVKLGDTWPGNIGSYYHISGIVARNSSENVYRIKGVGNILKRVSGYNASTDGNYHIYTVWTSGNILEDCVAGGTGRKMAFVYSNTSSTGNDNVFRRCFSAWEEWRGREFCSQVWPNGTGFQSYNGDRNLFENVISYGKTPRAGVDIFAQSSTNSVDNKVLGSVMTLSGANYDGTAVDYGTRPECTNGTNLEEKHVARAGVHTKIGSGVLDGNIFRDILTVQNNKAGIDVSLGREGSARNLILDHVTSTQNGENISPGDALSFTITNSDIPGTEHQQQGARLVHRYQDGVLQDGTNGTTEQFLWPWPMEQRIRDELGISVTCEIGNLINQHTKTPITNINVQDYCNSQPPPTATPTPPPSNSQPCPLLGDTNTCDGIVNILDYAFLSANFGSTNTLADLKTDGTINVLDYTILSLNFGNTN